MKYQNIINKLHKSLKDKYANNISIYRISLEEKYENDDSENLDVMSSKILDTTQPSSYTINIGYNFKFKDAFNGFFESMHIFSSKTLETVLKKVLIGLEASYQLFKVESEENTDIIENNIENLLNKNLNNLTKKELTIIINHYISKEEYEKVKKYKDKLDFLTKKKK